MSAPSPQTPSRHPTREGQHPGAVTLHAPSSLCRDAHDQRPLRPFWVEMREAFSRATWRELIEDAIGFMALIFLVWVALVLTAFAS